MSALLDVDRLEVTFGRTSAVPAAGISFTRPAYKTGRVQGPYIEFTQIGWWFGAKVAFVTLTVLD